MRSVFTVSGASSGGVEAITVAGATHSSLPRFAIQLR